MQQENTKYTPQYKLKLVIETLKDGVSIESVAEENGVSLDELKLWKSEFLEKYPYVFETRKITRQRSSKNSSAVEPYIKKLRKLRIDNNMSQEQVASFLGISRSMYSKYETGAGEMPADYLMMLTQLYGVSADYILGIEKQ